MFARRGKNNHRDARKLLVNLDRLRQSDAVDAGRADQPHVARLFPESAQPGGASVALRKLVESARRSGEAKDRVRQAQEITYRFMTAMAGNEAEFDEAIRALFAADKLRFEALTGIWPRDLADHIARLAAPVFEAPSSASE